MLKSVQRFVCVLVAIALATAPAYAADCRMIGATCVDGPSTKSISGVPIHRECWQWQATFECVDDAAQDYCAAIAKVPGCNLTSAVCSQTAFNSECLVTTKKYRCGNEITPPAGTIELAESHTVVYNKIDHSPCASYESNPSCQLAGKTCTQGPGTRTIDGVSIYKDCWQWEDNYSCVVNNVIDYCQPLKSAGCTVVSETCKEFAFTGACIKKSFNYSCEDAVSPLPANVVYLDTTYTIIDNWDMSQCQEYQDNANCVVAEKICLEPAETRVIDGQEVYRDCWDWHYEYSCASTALKSTCGDLENNPECALSKSQCVDYLPSGDCGLMEHEYKCLESEGNTTTELDCSNQTFCIDGTCFDASYVNDTDFGLVVAAMEAASEASQLAIFEGEKNKCTDTALAKCCKSSNAGATSSNADIATQVGAKALQVGAETIRAVGSPYVFEALVNTGSDMLGNYAFSALADGWLSPTSSMSFYGFTFEWGASGVTFVGFDPWSFAFAIAMMIIQEMMSCDEDSGALAIKRGQDLCHKVGSYCSSKAFGGCSEKTEGWCCFPSKLGRIINEQGREQIGKSWGDPKNPDCTGFSVADLQKLDFSKMDLTEFIMDIQGSVKIPDFAIDRLGNYY